MRLLHPIVIKCNRCNALLKISIDLECVSSEEKGMGAEYAYEGILYDSCPNCENDIEVSLYVWEYPVGAVNYQEEECSGAIMIQGPEYDPFEYDDIW